jgi:hypothetical protein
MRGEPHRITGGNPEPVAKQVGPSFTIVDDEGVAHEAISVVHPVLGRDNNIIEEDIEVTLCDYETSADWTRMQGPITCLRCLGWPNE